MQMVSCQRKANKAKYFKCSAHKKQQIKHFEHLSYVHYDDKDTNKMKIKNTKYFLWCRVGFTIAINFICSRYLLKIFEIYHNTKRNIAFVSF